MKDVLRAILLWFANLWNVAGHRISLLRSGDVLIEDYLARHLHGNPKYADPKRLNRYEFQVFSQGGEDGITFEIFRRIGTSNRFFVEFGVGDGLENNTVSLLLHGWQGRWIDGNASQVKRIRKNLSRYVEGGRLQVKNAYVSSENIEAHFADLEVPEEFDYLSIDIDGNDYWVWQAITRYKPRTVVVEYNAWVGPSLAWVQKNDPAHRWKGTTHFGTSVKALEILGRKKGYTLVGCNFMGNNAFFVRDELVGDRFQAPYSAEHHFEPARYFLYRRNGFLRELGEHEIIKD